MNFTIKAEDGKHELEKKAKSQKSKSGNYMLKHIKRLLFDHPIKLNTIIINRYVVKEVLGFGGFGITYIVQDLRNEEHHYVLKQLRPSRKGTKKGKNSFLTEADILASLTNAEFPTLRNAFIWNNHYCIVMDYIHGKTFEDLIFEEDRKFSEQEALKALLDVTDLVQILHRKGIVHNDLRIPNIILREKSISIIDFGLARRVEERKKQEEIQDDLYMLAHFLLFLLYSTYTPSGREKSWEEELSIHDNVKVMIRKMFGTAPCYKNIEALQNDIQKHLKK
ncbi:Kae1-associated kinase Bud32 [Priestia endophytica]|jgi:serine/threonine protein kinase, bacterial|nr:Kae1-associated kinase Bud32 [Priestia endophytica]